MKNLKLLCIALFALTSTLSFAAKKFETDTIKTSKGNLVITFIEHGTLMLQFNKTVIHVDPVNKYADYTKLPKADIILITHDHPDHLDTVAINTVSKKNTHIVTNPAGWNILKNGFALPNGNGLTLEGIEIIPVPAYNTSPDKLQFHPKGRDNGYVLTFGNKKVYIAGDTEDIPEMSNLKNISIAFLPMNLPYTMTPAQVKNAALMLKPAILYPYHYGQTNVQELLTLMKDVKGIEVRIRKMQ